MARYVVGTDIHFRLTEVFDTSSSWRVFPEPPCTRDEVCIEVESFSVESSDPSVLRIEETPAGIVGRALQPGSTTLVARRGLRDVVERVVQVDAPTAMAANAGGAMLIRRVPEDGRVVRVAGGALLVHVGFLVGEAEYFGDSITSFETALDASFPASGPRDLIRVVGSELGVEPLRIEGAGLSLELEVETVAAIDGLDLIELPWLPSGPRRSLVFVEDARLGGRSVDGSIPLEWRVDGELVGVGEMIECVEGSGAGRTVTATHGDAVASLALEIPCGEARLMSWTNGE